MYETHTIDYCTETLLLPIAAHRSPLSRMAGEGNKCHEPGERQPPKTPWVST